MEVDIPFDLMPPSGSGTSPNGSQILSSIGKTLYFCIPRNDQFLAYWDTVADRLFKIHNSLNLQGVFQILPLYDPPIDPALLVRAAASGLDVSAIVSGLNQPLPLVRFQFLVSKTIEICQEVKSLGANLLAAIEKQDNESLSLLRAQHENNVLQLADLVKYSQWQEAKKATEALQASLANAAQRYAYYQTLLNQGDGYQKMVSELTNPNLALNIGSVEAVHAGLGDEPQKPLADIQPDISQDSTSVSDGEVKTLTTREVEELNKLEEARSFQLLEGNLEGLGSGLGLIPQFRAHGTPLGVGASTGFGGVQLHAMMSSLAAVSKSVAEQLSYEAGKAAKLGAYSRRQLEWVFQSNSAAAEINQIRKQITGAQIREAIAQKEYDNHQVQMQNSQQIVEFLAGNSNDPTNPFNYATKTTTVGFYTWMKREIKSLYANAFQLAFEVAKKTERALQNELGDPSLTYIQYNYLDGTEGLFAGEG